MDHTPQFKRGEQTGFLLSQGRTAAPFHAPSGLAYLSIPTGPDTQTAVPLYSRGAELWLTAAFIRQYDCAPAPAALRAARKALEALALYDGPEKSAGKRILGDDKKITLDLAGDSGLCVEITPQGWTVSCSLEHAFEREPATGALPVPDETAGRAS